MSALPQTEGEVEALLAKLAALRAEGRSGGLRDLIDDDPRRASTTARIAATKGCRFTASVARAADATSPKCSRQMRPERAASMPNTVSGVTGSPDPSCVSP